VPRSWIARELAITLVVTSIALGPAASPAVAAAGDPFRFIYDQNGRLAAAVTPTDSAKWTYDAVGNITAITRQVATTLSVIEFAPHSGQVGTTVTVYGTAFSTTPSSNTVKFNGTVATVLSSTTTQIVTTVPAGATTGTISVKVGNTTATSSASFSVLGAIAPTITGFSPAIAIPGATLTITGTNFDTNVLFDKTVVGATVLSDGTVIGGVFARVTAATATTITAIVPPLPNSGKVVVSTPNGVAISSNDFFAVPTGFVASDIGPTGRLTFGSQSNFTWSVAGSVGLFVIDGAVGHRMSLALSGSISQGYYVWIRNPDGSLLVGSSCCSTTWIDTISFPMAGAYTVVVDAAGTGTGSLSLTPYDVPVDATSAVTPGGSPVTLNATVPGQNITFTFTGSVGQRVSMTLAHTGIPDGYWFSIKNPDGTYLYGISCCFISWVDTMTLTQAGTYTILVDLAGADLGSATATLYDVPADATSSITPGGSPVTLNATVPGQNITFTFTGSVGQRVSLTLSHTGIPDGYWFSIKNPDGSYLYGISCCFISWADTMTLTQAGTYTILVDLAGPDVGSATATLYDVPADATSAITPGGSPVTLNATVPGQNITFTFTGSVGQRVSLALSHTGIPDGYWFSIKNPDGSYLYGISCCFISWVDTTTLTQAGTYTILVDLAGADVGSATATLYEVPADATTGLVVDGPSQTLTVTTPGQNAVFTFSGTTGDHLTFTLAAAYGFGWYLTVRNPDGAPLWGTYCCGNTIATFTLTQTGAHSILVDPVTTATGDATGTLAHAGGLAPNGPVVAAGETSASGLDGTGGGTGRPLAAPVVSVESTTQHTRLVGQVLEVEGPPLAGVIVKIGEFETRTDSLGRFELVDAPAGHQTLCVDGRALRSGDFGMYEIGVDVREAGTTDVGFPIWLSRIDDAHGITVDSPTTGEVVLTTPKIPGLEIHLAPGTVITNDEGEVIHDLSISELSRVRPPFPLPSLVETPVYFTVQPGGAYLSKKARIYYPNLVHAPAGTRVQFWHYSPDGRGWYVYGWGEVSADGKQVVPDPGVGVYELTGSMIHFPFLDLPALWAAVGDFLSDGDPVDLGTGLFNMEKTDLAVADVMPVALGRTYRSQDTTSRFFGIGSTSSLEIFLKLVTAWQELVLVLPDGGQVRYLRINPGNLQADAIFEHTATPTRFYKSRVTWNGTGWDLKLVDGTKYVFNNDTTLAAVVDRFSNRVTFDRVIGISDHINVARSPNGRWLKFSYDGSDRISMVEDNIGRTVLYTYDPSGRLWKVTDPNGKVTEYGYDGAHRLTTIKDPRLITWVTNVYDPTSGRVSQQTQVDGGVYQFAYTVVNGKVTQTDVTDPRNFVRRVTFNASGYGVTDTVALGQPEQQTTSYERDPSSNLVLSTTDALGRVTRNTYDTSGNPLTITSLYATPDAVTTTFSYDALFNDLASVKDPLNHTTVFGYDAKGNRRSETDPLTHQTLFQYYPSGQLFTSTNALAKTTTFTYQNGDVATTSDPLGRVTKRFTDAAGRPTFVTDPLGNTVRTDYDLLNRVTQVTDPRSGVTVFTYDENGNRLTVKDAKLNVTTYTYDNMDQVATRKDALLKTETYTYDKQGNVLTTTDRKGQVTEFRYDSLGRQSFAGFGRTGTAPNFTYQSTVSYTRDAANRLHIAVDSVGGTITREYDLLDRLTSETTGQGAITYQYDSANRRSQLQVAGQTAVVYGYDDADHLMSVTQGTTVVGFGYDDADRRTSLSLPGNLSLDYGYDDASQLLSITYKHSGSTIGDLAYSYDLAGRRATTSGSYARLNLPAAVTTATYNVDNQLTKWGSTNITYDLNGNMNGDGTNTYSWNARNQLSAVTKSGQTLPSFTYDAFGRRQKKTLGATVTSYLYDGGNTVQELTGGSPTANVLTGPGLDEIFQRSEGPTTRTFLADALGSVVALADTAGVVQTSYTYAPYGETTVSGAASNNKNQYTGRENDSDGLFFYRARYFQPVFGRFVSEDPLGFGGGDSDLYAYTGGRPTYLTDPSGLILPLLGTCAAGAALSIATDFVRFLQAGARKEDAPSHGELLGSAAGGCVAGLAGLGAARLVSFVRVGRLASKLGVTRGELQEIASAWDKSTFKSAIDSAVHHYEYHGEGQGVLQYTRDAVDFLARNGLRAFTKALRTGGEGIKINTPDYFGIYTFIGKIVSYGPR
jgi:RHS repeat-associated protein